MPNLIVYNSEYKRRFEIQLTKKVTATLREKGIEGLRKILKSLKPADPTRTTPARQNAYGKFIDLIIDSGDMTISVVPTHEELRKQLTEGFRTPEPRAFVVRAGRGAALSEELVRNAVEYVKASAKGYVVYEFVPRPEVPMPYRLWSDSMGELRWRDLKGKYASKTPEAREIEKRYE